MTASSWSTATSARPRAFFDVDLGAMAKEAGQPCWASLERFRTCHADGQPRIDLDWEEERDTELVGFRASPEGRGAP